MRGLLLAALGLGVLIAGLLPSGVLVVVIGLLAVAAGVLCMRGC